jgi:hypothetical protein
MMPGQGNTLSRLAAAAQARGGGHLLQILEPLKLDRILVFVLHREGTLPLDFPGQGRGAITLHY